MKNQNEKMKAIIEKENGKMPEDYNTTQLPDANDAGLVCIKNHVKEQTENKREMVYTPQHYVSGSVETIEKIDIVLDGLSGKEAYYLGNVLKYFDRAGHKDDIEQDLSKANNYAHRLVTGKWRNQ